MDDVLASDNFFSFLVPFDGASVMLNSATELITIPFIGFSSVCFSFVSWLSGGIRKKKKKERLVCNTKRSERITYVEFPSLQLFTSKP